MSYNGKPKIFIILPRLADILFHLNSSDDNLLIFRSKKFDLAFNPLTNKFAGELKSLAYVSWDRLKEKYAEEFHSRIKFTEVLDVKYKSFASKVKCVTSHFYSDIKVCDFWTDFNNVERIEQGWLYEDEGGLVVSYETGNFRNFLTKDNLPKTGDSIQFRPDSEITNIIIVKNEKIMAICHLENDDMWTIKGSTLKIVGIDSTRLWNINTGEPIEKY
jgi:hypothetical protein